MSSEVVMVNIKNANDLFRSGNYVGALDAYRQIQKMSPFYADLVTQNIRSIESRLSNDEFQIMRKNPSAEDSLNPVASNLKLAVIFHVYHESIVSEILNYIDNIKHDFDLFITTPLQRSSPAIVEIFERFASVYYIHTINRGRDILPFLNAYENIQNYDLCLKIHTKQGLTNYGDLWREVSLQCLLKDEAYVSDLIKKFESDPVVALAGPKDFYLSGRRLIHGNHQNLTNICSILGIEYREDLDWAFFAGTMFWFRPSVYKDHIDTLKSLKFDKETGKQDGGIEHSIERVFGLVPSYFSAKALLLSGYDDESKIEVVSLPDKVGTEDPTKYLSDISKSKLRKQLIVGDVNKQSAGALADMKVRGWLAKQDDKSQRSFIIRIGAQEFEGVANIYRVDLEDAKIHDGCHAFELNVPLKFADGNEHLVSLFDKKSGLPVANNKYKWNAIKRPYSNFTEYLSWSHSGQYVSIPFVEEDKRAFSIMELVADDLSSLSDGLSELPLVSIVMPTYNRANLIGRAIKSVLDQKYKNWELIIVDDGSADDTNLIVSKFDDARIRYLKLDTNKGVSGARNNALSLANGEYVAYLDSDNDWDSRYLSAMIVAAKLKVKNANALYCGQLVYSGKSRELSGVRFGMFNKSLLLNNNYIDLNCFIHKRLLSSGVPSFDVSLKRFVDWDFIISISNHEIVASVPVILSNYYLDVSDNSLTSNDLLSKHIEKVRERIDSYRLKNREFLVPMGGLSNGISIVIPSYQAKDEIKNCIASIEPYFNIQDGHKIELIIVDNKSSEDVVKYLRSYAHSHSGCVKLIELDKNYGFTFAVNLGIKSATPGYDVLLLNNDAQLAGGSVFHLQKALYDNSHYGISVPAQILPGGTETICAHVPYALPEYDVDVNISVHHKNLSRPPLFYDGGCLEVDFAPFFCVLIKASTLKLAPFLDELNGRHYRSDRTYCEYIRSGFNLKVAYCPDAIVYHGLQKSTTELKKKSHNSNEYKKIFLQNTWSDSELNFIGRRLPGWNVNF